MRADGAGSAAQRRGPPASLTSVVGTHHDLVCDPGYRRTCERNVVASLEVGIAAGILDEHVDRRGRKDTADRTALLWADAPATTLARRRHNGAI
jgi:hypothetical protein